MTTTRLNALFLALALVAASAPSAEAARPAVKGARSGAAAPAATRSREERDTRASRTLEEITIQGEIDVPQVLFITGRPRPFYDDRLHRLYRPTTRQLLEALTTPGSVSLRPIGPTREASR